MRRLALLSGAALAIGAAGLLYGAHRFDQAGPLTRDVVTVIPHGGLGDVADALVGAGIVDNPVPFEIATRLTAAEGPVRAGELRFPARASLHQVLNVLRFGAPISHRITFAEGLTAAQISRVLAQADDLAGDVAVPREGAMLPGTYLFERGTSRAAIVTRATAAMAQLLRAQWPGRAATLALATPGDAIILASIVEREARLPDERPMIARVFLNRLAARMRLQADPTAAYGAAGGLGRLERPLDHADLLRDDPYNTYVVAGLPDGPICSPGTAAIEAVLHPASGDARYFVADGSGGHVFSDALADHNAHVAHLRALRH